MIVSHYTILNIEQNATEAEIKKAHKRLSLKVHPDKNGEETSHFMKMVNEAKDKLLDWNDRRRHDQELRNPGQNQANVAEIERLRRSLAQLRTENATLKQQVKQSSSEKIILRNHAEVASAQLRQAQQVNEMREAENNRLNADNNRLKAENKKLNAERERIAFEYEVNDFRCRICLNVVPPQNFWTARCCPSVFCNDCLVDRGDIKCCPLVDCKEPIEFSSPDTRVPLGWTQNPPLITKQLERVAQFCTYCNKTVLKSEYERHTLYDCIMQTCFKCNGEGTIAGCSPFQQRSTCQLCEGSKVHIRGEWTQCFACKDRTQVTHLPSPCDVCHDNKCIKGKWSPCFRCGCKGTIAKKSEQNDFTVTRIQDGSRELNSHSITAMSQYEDKSFEELRLEWYANRSTQSPPCDVCNGRKMLAGEWKKCNNSSCNAGRVKMNGFETKCSICNGIGAISTNSTFTCPISSGIGCENCEPV